MALIRGEDWQQAFISSLSEFLRPYTDENILTGALIDVSRNKTADGWQVYNPQADGWAQFQAKWKHVAEKAAPGFIDTARRIDKAARGEINSSGRAYDLPTEVFGAFGWRVSTMDVQQSLQRKASEYDRGNQDARRMLSSVANRRGTVSRGELAEAYSNMEVSRKRLFSDMQDSINAARSLGVSEKEIVASLESSGLGKQEAKKLADGKYEPWRPSDKAFATIADKDLRSDRLDDVAKVAGGRNRRAGTRRNPNMPR
jgi:hypothetical protein